MQKVFYVDIYYSKEDKVFYVGIPGFGGTSEKHATYGETQRHAHEMAKDCIEALLASYSKHGEPIPRQEGIDKSGLEPIEIDTALDLCAVVAPAARAITEFPLRQRANTNQT